MTTSAPLNYEASVGSNNLQVSSTLPSEVVQVLQNARFVRPISTVNSGTSLLLHLATCTNNFPHVSLMNYTYLESSPYSPTPTIIMTTDPTSKKTLNLISNPHVSLLVHDWVSHRPPTTGRRGSTIERAGSPPPEASRSSLANLLLNLNTSALSSISATINGDARIAEKGTEEETYYKEMHLDNNTFDDGEEAGLGSWNPREQTDGDGGRESFIKGEEVRVVVVNISGGRVSDWKGAVRDWTLEGSEAQVSHAASGSDGMVNGIS